MQSHALGTRAKFQLEILTTNMISGIVYFREIILESSQNVCETTPWLSYKVSIVAVDALVTQVFLYDVNPMPEKMVLILQMGPEYLRLIGCFIFQLEIYKSVGQVAEAGSLFHLVTKHATNQQLASYVTRLYKPIKVRSGQGRIMLWYYFVQ